MVFIVVVILLMWVIVVVWVFVMFWYCLVVEIVVEFRWMWKEVWVFFDLGLNVFFYVVFVWEVSISFESVILYWFCLFIGCLIEFGLDELISCKLVCGSLINILLICFFKCWFFCMFKIFWIELICIVLRIILGLIGCRVFSSVVICCNDVGL